MDISTFNQLTTANDEEALKAVCTDAFHAVVGDVVICGGCYALVTFQRIWPPNHPNRPKLPIKDNLYMVELITTNGSRAYGLTLP